MTLTELINYFRATGNLKEFFENNSLDIESEVVEIYMKKPFNVENKIEFFEIEKTEGKIEFEADGIKFYNLIDFYSFLDFIEESKTQSQVKLTDKELAEKLLNYCIKDA